MPFTIKCPSCGQKHQVGDEAAGKQFSCAGCKSTSLIPARPTSSKLAPKPLPALTPTVAEAPQEATRPRSAKRPRKPVQETTHWSRYALLAMLVGYFPFLLFVVLVFGGLAAWLFLVGSGSSLLRIPAFVFGGLLALSVLHLLSGLHVLFFTKEEPDNLEFELPEQWQAGLRDMVEEVAEQRRLAPPEVIRLHATDVAKVYQDKHGDTVLVIGGMAVAAFTQKALSGIVAHELGHCTSGDTALSRTSMRWHRVMMQLEFGFWRRWWYRWNPLTWLVKLYHRLYFLVWAINSREQEYAADRQEVALVGKEEAAAALMLIMLLHESSFTELGSVASAVVETNERMDKIFAEQVRRIKVTSQSDWEDVLRKALRNKTGWFDSHPGLEDRLKAMKVSPKKALRYMMDVLKEESAPATALFANWPVVERFLTDRILTIVREYYAAKEEMEAIYRAIARSMG